MLFELNLAGQRVPTGETDALVFYDAWNQINLLHCYFYIHFQITIKEAGYSEVYIRNPCMYPFM